MTVLRFPTPPLSGVDLTEPTWTRCPRCGVEHSGSGVCWDCEQGQVREREHADRVCSAVAALPAAFRGLSFDSPTLAMRVTPAGILGAARDLVDSPRLVIRGRGGSGKTSLAAAMLRERVGRHRGSAHFVPAYDLSGHKFELAPQLLSADLVLVDDLGNERQMASSLVPELFYQRHAADKATWVTTWCNEHQLTERYGEHVSRRVYEFAKTIELGARP